MRRRRLLLKEIDRKRELTKKKEDWDWGLAFFWILVWFGLFWIGLDDLNVTIQITWWLVHELTNEWMNVWLMYHLPRFSCSSFKLGYQIWTWTSFSGLAHFLRVSPAFGPQVFTFTKKIWSFQVLCNYMFQDYLKPTVIRTYPKSIPTYFCLPHEKLKKKKNLYFRGYLCMISRSHWVVTQPTNIDIIKLNILSWI